jgi:hypothetical protein
MVSVLCSLSLFFGYFGQAHDSKSAVGFWSVSDTKSAVECV